MAKHLEIETKWDAKLVKRDDFNKDVLHAIKSRKLDQNLRFIVAKGWDTYYRNKSGDVIRHRDGKDCKELTAKGRLSLDSIKVRKEVNVRLAENSDNFDVFCLMKMCGFEASLRIFKVCDIYFFEDSGTHVSIVWYQVRDSKRKGKRTFLEVEVEGASEKKCVQVLNKWEGIVEEMSGLQDKDKINSSLYEIYTGGRYKMRSK